MKPNRLFSAITFIAAIFALANAAQASAGKKRIPRQAHPVMGSVNINNAPLAKLMLLPYVGRSRAHAIIQFRTRNKFRQPKDLLRVKGIGRRTFEKIRAHVTVDGPTTIRRTKPMRRR